MLNDFSNFDLLPIGASPLPHLFGEGGLKREISQPPPDPGLGLSRKGGCHHEPSRRQSSGSCFSLGLEGSYGSVHALRCAGFAHVAVARCFSEGGEPRKRASVVDGRNTSADPGSSETDPNLRYP